MSIDAVHTRINPLTILRQTMMDLDIPFRLGVEREWIWLIPAFLVDGFGIAGSLAELGFDADLVPRVRGAAGLLTLLGVGIAVYFVWMPKCQIWFDRNKREVLFVETRTFRAKKRLADAARRSIDGYAHVRVCEREYASDPLEESTATRTDYRVSLEGPIPFAFDDGRVHSRSDALAPACFSSERKARRFAARVAYVAGLEILNASDW